MIENQIDPALIDKQKGKKSAPIGAWKVKLKIMTSQRTDRQTNQPINQPTDQPTNRPTDQQTNRPTDRVIGKFALQ